VRKWEVVLLPEAIEERLVKRFVGSPVEKVRLNMLFNLHGVSNKLIGEFDVIEVHRGLIAV
jgi:hypothetical protein